MFESLVALVHALEGMSPHVAIMLVAIGALFLRGG